VIFSGVMNKLRTHGKAKNRILANPSMGRVRTAPEEYHEIMIK
jgi:hypothetical protein